MLLLLLLAVAVALPQERGPVNLSDENKLDRGARGYNIMQGQSGNAQNVLTDLEEMVKSEEDDNYFVKTSFFSSFFDKFKQLLGLISAEPSPVTTVEPSGQGNCDCGLKVSASGRIVGGEEADLNEHPWQVGIVYVNGKQPWCGGTLISDRHIMTAAHCTAAVGSNPSQIQVLLGMHQSSKHQTATRVDVESVNDDPNYSFPNSDFSILTLATPVQFSESVRPACLPSDLSKNYAGQVATVTGWGRLSSQGGQPDVLMEVNVKVTSEMGCRRVYGSEINGIHLCAVGSGKDSCQGDSGGPLVVKENGRWTLIGVVSFGDGCAKKGVPGVYARVTNRMDWIKQNTFGTATSGSPKLCQQILG